jgi:hypothetical protein
MSYLTLVMLALEILNPSDPGLGATFMVGATCLACAPHVALSPNLPYTVISLKFSSEFRPEPRFSINRAIRVNLGQNLVRIRAHLRRKD